MDVAPLQSLEGQAITCVPAQMALQEQSAKQTLTTVNRFRACKVLVDYMFLSFAKGRELFNSTLHRISPLV